MRSRSLIINSKFKPFSYQEMLHPVLLADTAHKELETSLGELSTKAGAWENIADQDREALAYNMYTGYMDNLSKEIEGLSKQGLTPTSRQNLNRMRERYSKEILPIENAYNTRLEQAKMQQQEIGRDQTIRYNRNAATTSLDDYIRDPMLSYRGVSGNILAGQVAMGAEALAKEIRENPNKFKNVMDNQYIEIVQKYGFSADEVDAAIQGRGDANPLLTNVVNKVMDSAGLDDFTPEARNELRALSSQGLYRAIGTDKTQYMQNWKEQQRMQAALQRELAGIRAGAKTGSGNDGNGPHRDLHPTSYSGMKGNPKGQVPSLSRDSEGRITSTRIQELRLKQKELMDKQKQAKDDVWGSYRQDLQGKEIPERAALRADIAKLDRVTGEVVYKEYVVTQSKLDKVTQELRDEYRAINNAEKKYRHLDEDPIKAIEKGMALEKSISVKQDYDSGQFFENSDDVKTNMFLQLYDRHSESPQNGLVKIVNGKPDGKVISKGDAEKIFNNKKTHLRTSTSDGTIISDGDNHYAIVGETGVNKFNRNFQVVKQALGDYTLEGIGNPLRANYEKELRYMSNSDKINLIRKQGRRIGDGVYQLTVYDSNTQDYMKLIDDNGVLIQGSLHNEIEDGSISTSYLRDHANTQGRNVVHMFSNKKSDIGTVSTKATGFE